MNTFTKLARFPALGLIVLGLIALALSSFSNNPVQSQEPDELEFEILQQLPHSDNNFTQGLFFYEGSLYESTGHYGQSKLIRYKTDFHSELMARTVAPKYFAEGATEHNGTIYQLTWQAETALAYNPSRLSQEEGFTYEGEGWGLTSDGDVLWLSNGSDLLNKLDTDGEILASINVTFNGAPLNLLNELEWIDGNIFANRWYDNHVYVIDPETGRVTAHLDLQEIAAPELVLSAEHVLNGIAWNTETETLWVTGKNWQYLYELKLSEND